MFLDLLESCSSCQRFLCKLRAVTKRHAIAEFLSWKKNASKLSQCMKYDFNIDLINTSCLITLRHDVKKRAAEETCECSMLH